MTHRPYLIMHKSKEILLTDVRLPAETYKHVKLTVGEKTAKSLPTGLVVTTVNLGGVDWYFGTGKLKFTHKPDPGEYPTFSLEFSDSSNFRNQIRLEDVPQPVLVLDPGTGPRPDPSAKNKRGKRKKKEK